MSKFQGMTIEQALQSIPVLKPPDLVDIFGRSKRTLNRWQNHEEFENPMPRPFSESRGGGNNYDSGKVLDWYHTLPIRKKKP